jgi:hypothetical chaperone protein
MDPIGIDFGTTNSAIAVARAHDVRLAQFANASGERRSTFRSILYFDFDAPDRRGAPSIHAGPQAIERYLASSGHGRLVQSLKSHLASASFDKTTIGAKNWSLEDLVAAFLERLRAAAEADLGSLADSSTVVVGRPVRWAGAERPEDDDLAVRRLRAAFARAGFPQVIFEPEPLAAAYAYERSLDHDELVLVADFGGGTTDFCLLRVGPSRRAIGAALPVLSIDGVALAGDAFDGEIVAQAIAPKLGAGSRYRPRMATEGGREPLEIPGWIYRKLRRWHHLSFLRSRETLALLEDLRKQSLEPEKLRALLHVIEADLGLHLHRAVEETKIGLSNDVEAPLRFDDEPLSIDERVARPDFERWIGGSLEEIRAALDRTLASASVAPTEVDAVFLTGGSSLVPAVRRIFAERFGASRLRGGDELVSVGVGLALRARDLSRA